MEEKKCGRRLQELERLAHFVLLAGKRYSLGLATPFRANASPSVHFLKAGILNVVEDSGSSLTTWGLDEDNSSSPSDASGFISIRERIKQAKLSTRPAATDSAIGKHLLMDSTVSTVREEVLVILTEVERRSCATNCVLRLHPFPRNKSFRG